MQGAPWVKNTTAHTCELERSKQIVVGLYMHHRDTRLTIWPNVVQQLGGGSSVDIDDALQGCNHIKALGACVHMLLSNGQAATRRAGKPCLHTGTLG